MIPQVPYANYKVSVPICLPPQPFVGLKRRSISPQSQKATCNILLVYELYKYLTLHTIIHTASPGSHRFIPYLTAPISAHLLDLATSIRNTPVLLHCPRPCLRTTATTQVADLGKLNGQPGTIIHRSLWPPVGFDNSSGSIASSLASLHTS